MEPLTNQVGSRNSAGNVTRRDLLGIAAGCGLSFALPGLGLRAAQRRGAERQKSFILLWLDGGPSQLETWDPHPGGVIGGTTTAIETTVPGLKIANLYPQMAEQIHNLSVIRSLVSKEGDHERGTYLLKTGYRPEPTLTHPALGAILAHELPDESVEIPQHISLCNSAWPARGGFLGAQWDAFKIYDPGRYVRNLQPPVGKSRRQSRRLKNLEVLSNEFRRGREIPSRRTLHQHMIESALAMMSSDQLRAFKLDDEPESLVDAYGDTQFGRGCLVARRLVEQGVRAVEVNLRGFDSHANNFEAHQKNAKVLDPAFASLIRDLDERDLLESTVVLCIGEFGRTPNINLTDGRDHWPSGFSCVVGGGGMKSGVVIGETDPAGKRKDPVDPVSVADLYATVLSTIGVDHEQEVITPIGRPMAYCEGSPIAELL